MTPIDDPIQSPTPDDPTTPPEAASDAPATPPTAAADERPDGCCDHEYDDGSDGPPYVCGKPAGHTDCHESYRDGAAVATWENAGDDSGAPEPPMCGDVYRDGAEGAEHVCNKPAGHEEAHGDGLAIWTGPIEPGTLAKPATLPLTQRPANRISIIEDDWNRLMSLLASVEATKAELEECKRASRDAKENHDAAEEALQRALARIRDGRTATQEPRLPFEAPEAAAAPEPAAGAPAVPDAGDPGLPHGGIHQSDVVDAANNDSANVALAERLIGAGWRHITPLIVAGYTEQECADLIAWLDGDTQQPPPFAEPQEPEAPATEAAAADPIELGPNVGNIVADTFPRGKVAFTAIARGIEIVVTYSNDEKGQDALVEIGKDGRLIKVFLWPAYKIWNLQAHADDIAADLERGLMEAGSLGPFGGNVYEPGTGDVPPQPAPVELADLPTQE